MSDMYFKRLPDKSTPLIPGNLDKLNDIKVSPTEPTTNEKVWIQKGKNLFNKKNYLGYFWFSSDGTLYATGDNHIVTNFIEVKPNTQYTFSINTAIYLSIRGYDNNKNHVETFFDNTAQTITFTTGENTYFVRVGIGNGLNYINNNIQLEQGSTSTEYEAYIEPVVWLKNDNGVYEPFYKESEMNKVPEIITTETGIAEKYPDGRLVQRGNYSIEALEVNTGAFKNVTLPIPFIDNTYSVSINKTSGGSNGFAGVADAFIRDPNIIYFTHWNFIGYADPISYCWIAIGRWK